MKMCKSFSLLVVVIIIIALIVLESDCSCIRSDVRLVGGSGNYEGNVQVCINGVWGYVCDNSWDSNDAQVVCRQLGYYTTDAVYKRYSYYGYGSGTIWMDYVYCTGSEDRLIDCPTSDKIGMTNCGYNEMAGVYCAFAVGGSNCTNGDIRLAHYSTSSNYGRSEGRVEVCYNNEWGTVCSNGWDSTDATVACKQLGYSGSITHYTYNYYGIGSGSIWLDDLSCSNYYSSLFHCSYSTVTSDCTHSNDVQVRCYSIDTSSCTNGDVQIWSAYDSTPDNEGIPLVCISGNWYPIEDNSYCYSYVLACKAAGYSGLRYYSSNGGRYYGYYDYTHYRLYCSSSDTNLNSCSYSGYSSGWWSGSIRIRCYTDQLTASNCTEGSVRLVNGETSNEGMAEYCYKKEWAPICYIDQYSAYLICKQLGYENLSGNYLIILGKFEKSDTGSQFDYLSCSSTSTNLSECSVQLQTSSSCVAPSCNKHYGLRCYGPTNECNDGDTRLVDGQIEQEGRPEVCVNGIWSQICDDGWDISDAYVACVTLGYSGSLDPIAYYNTEFGVGYGPIVWSSVDCNHWNTDIHDCSKNVFPNFNCGPPYEIAGVRCTEGCTDGDVRLVGGNSVHEGTVEICLDELWGLISDDGWNENDALVVCTQLGYIETDFESQLGSYYGKPHKTIHLKNVDCSSKEDNILKCDSTRLSLAEGKTLQSNTEVAGVHCNPVKTTPNCNEGFIRLVNGSNNREGRVEVCVNGVWGSVCDNGWDSTDGHVICHQLGYTREEPTIYYDSYFGDGSYPVVYSNVNCKGWEDSISDCDKDDHLSFTCYPGNTAGLKCNEDVDSNNSSQITAVSNDGGSTAGVTLGAVSLVTVLLVILAVVVLILIHYRRSLFSQRQQAAGNETMRASDLKAREEPPRDYEEMQVSSNASYQIKHIKPPYY